MKKGSHGPMTYALVRCLIVGVMLFLTGCGRVTGMSMRSAVGSELTEAQKFSLKNLEGGVTDLSQVLTQKKLVLIDFWASWCGYCVEEMPDLIKLQARGFTVLAVNVGETARQAASFKKKFKLNFPIVLDEDNAVARNYGVVGIPVSYLVSPDGKVLGEYHEFTPKLISDVEKSLS
jgi:thiol-disulfide isomerase/thioredoxin